MTATSILEVRDLSVEFTTDRGIVRPVDGVDLDLKAGEMLGLVGESGSGKSVTSLAITGLTDYTGGRIVSGSVRLGDVEILSLAAKGRAAVLGRDIGMIFQQPRRSLNPTMPVGQQIAESVRRHRGVSRKQAWNRAVEMLDRVRIPDPARRAREYPFSFSGGMAQRVMIAMALACEPKVLIADEPTTALDATVQFTVMELLRDLQRDLDVAVLLITHDLGVAWGSCDRVAVMYCGQIVEQGPVREVLTTPTNPYTQGLLRATPHRGMQERLIPIVGSVPSPADLPTGCRFHPRCPRHVPGTCDITVPDLQMHSPGTLVRCLRPAS
ncbi:ABC transporter ATP-binding protein [Prescottella equi]|uniref:ABC transporter ATP-binding protein n=1 Tax=Rhodococcus hoagii TaxID=43767 RepID=UPI003850DEFA